MRVYFDNVNTQSSSGPNQFANKLAQTMIDLGYEISSSSCDVQLSFISIIQKKAPTALRLDGIYFNSEQSWQQMNRPIKKSHEQAEAVIYQSEFNKKLVERYFGSHRNSYVIHNGTRLDWISSIPPIDSPVLDEFAGIWSCASSWRPHKRLRENVEYFLAEAPQDHALVVAGENPDYIIHDPRIIYTGSLDWMSLIGLFRRSTVFLHLAYLDHCPNVVVDARASGCQIVCSSTGGTKEIAGEDAVVLEEDEWNFEPCKLYDPPKLNFDKIIKNVYNSNLDIGKTALSYIEILNNIRNCEKI